MVASISLLIASASTQLEERLHNMKARGVVLEEGQSLQDLYKERCVLYQTYADLSVSEGIDSLEDTVSRVYEAVNG